MNRDREPLTVAEMRAFCLGAVFGGICATAVFVVIHLVWG